MIRLDDGHLMMIEPTNPIAAIPVIDELTRKAAGVLRFATIGNRYRGQHACTGRGCKATSDNADHHFGGMLTNSLAVHYLARHRDDVDPDELAKIAALDVPEVEPTMAQINGQRPDARATVTSRGSIRR